MTSNAHRERALFSDAIELPRGERTRFVEAQCGDDQQLCERVLALLRSSDDTLFLSEPPVKGVGVGGGGGGPAWLGKYQVIRLLGEGGMGTVYEAQQENPRRRVALKVLRHGLASRAMLARFEHEANVLGQLHHPGIAQIYEAGTFETPSGPQPYFAMEFITGPSLIDFVGQRHLSVTQRLELFTKVCDAVQHSHQKGVVHRDLKPANILVESATSDGDGQPRILDFGIARVVGADLERVTMQTGPGQLLGTLPYMSPEQVTADPEALDTRSDVYSLGIVLYQMMTDQLPYEVTKVAIPEAARIIREEPPRHPATTHPELAGDIATIILKALHKDREHRYQTAAEFAADIRRFLAHEPISARPPTTIYQLRKFAQRHRALAAGVLLAAGALVVGSVFTATFALREARQRDLADARAIEAHRNEQAAMLLAYRASLTAAQVAIDSGDSDTAQAQLEASPPSLRGWEWQYLTTMADRSLGEIGVLREPWLNVVFGPDHSLLSGTTEGAVEAIDLTPGFRRRTVGHIPADIAADLQSCASSPDGGLLAVSGAKATALLDLRTGAVMWRIESPMRVESGGFDATGRSLWAADVKRGDIVQIDVQTSEVLRNLGPSDPAVAAPTLGRDGRTLIYCIDFSPRVVDPANGRVVWEPPSERYAYDITGRWLTVLDGYVLATYDAATGAMVRNEPIPGTGFAGCDFTQNLWAIGDARGRLFLKDPADPNFSVAIAAGTGAIYPHFSPDGDRIISTTKGGTSRVWDAHCGPQPATFVGTGRSMGSFADFSEDDRIAAGAGWGSVRIWDAQSGVPISNHNVMPDMLQGIAISPSGRQVAVVSHKWDLAVLDVATGKSTVTRGEFGAGQQTNRRIPLLWTDESHLVVGTIGGGVRALAVSPSGACESQWVQEFSDAPITVATFDRAGHILYAGDMKGRVWTLSVDSDARDDSKRRATSVMLQDAPISDISLSADGTRIAAACDASVYIIDRDSHAAIGSIVLGSLVTGISWNRTGDRIAASTTTAAVYLCDPSRLCEVFRLRVLDSAQCRPRFAHDGARLFVVRSNLPPAVYEAKAADSRVLAQRDAARAAQPLLAKWRPRTATSVDLALACEADEAFDASVRDQASRIARAEGDVLRWMNSDAWLTVQRAGMSKVDYEIAERRTAMIDAGFPDHAALLNTHGIALYRVDRHAECIRPLERSDELLTAQGTGPDPTNSAVIAMALAKMGKLEEASERLNRAKAVLAASTNPDAATRRLVAEAEVVVQSAR